MQNRLDILHIILPALLVAASLSSCRKEPSPVPAGDTAIAFSSSVSGTKALINDVADMTAFKVYGYYTIDGTASYTAFDGTEVTRTGALWQYSPARYWVPDAKYTFLGFHPSDAAVTINSTSLNANGRLSNPSFTYVLDNDFTQQEDFMFAHRYKEDPGIVDLNFNHLLCQVTIDVYTQSNTQIIKLNKFTLSGMSTSGRYTAFSNSSNGSWSVFSGYASFEETLGIDVTDEKASIINSGNGYLMIPRSYDSAALKLSMDCSISTDGGETYKGINIQKSFPATEWQPGKKYHYSAEITVDYNIQFSEPTITPWGSEQTTGSVIIK